MKSTKLNKTLTAFFAATLLSFGISAIAQPSIGRLADELELTDEQREQLATLRAEQREEGRAVAAQRREETQAEREAARTQADERQAVQQARMAEILTPEQMTRLEEMRTQAVEQREDRMARMREMGPRDGGFRNQRGTMPRPRPGNR